MKDFNRDNTVVSVVDYVIGIRFAVSVLSAFTPIALTHLSCRVIHASLHRECASYLFSTAPNAVDLYRLQAGLAAVLAIRMVFNIRETASRDSKGLVPTEIQDFSMVGFPQESK